MEDESILQLIREAKPDVLLVAFGNPKQEKWIAKHRDRLNVPVCIGVGASIDFLARGISRAPLWMQRFGLEWMHRLANEPRRLALRYLNNALFLLRYLSMQLVMTSLQPRAVKEAKVSMTRHGAVLAFEIAGSFSGSAAEQILDKLERCNYSESLILDLTLTEFISPEALGLLVYLAHRCAQTEKELWIAGGPPTLRSVFHATFPAGEPFRIARSLQDALRFVRSPSPHGTRSGNRRSAAA